MTEDQQKKNTFFFYVIKFDPDKSRRYSLYFIKKKIIHTTLNHKHFATKSQNNFKKIVFPSKIENVIDTNLYETEIEFCYFCIGSIGNFTAK